MEISLVASNINGVTKTKGGLCVKGKGFDLKEWDEGEKARRSIERDLVTRLIFVCGLSSQLCSNFELLYM